VTVGEGREVRRGGEIASPYVTIHSTVELLERIGEALVMSARIASELVRLGGEQ